MWRRISEFFYRAPLMITGSARAFKKDERGLSGVVVAILLILVAVLAIVLIWTFLNDMIRDLWNQIVGNANTIS